MRGAELRGMKVRCAPALVVLVLVILVAALACGAPPAGPAENIGQSSAELVGVPSFGPNPGNLTMQKYVPAAMPATPRPLVVALHGCTQTPDTYVAAGWNALADQWKFYVVYAQQNTAKNNSLGCFNWGGRWPSAPNAFLISAEPLQTDELTRGHGENESIKEMVDQMKKDHAIDDKMVFVTGLSAGGGMVSVMLAVWPDVFAGGAIMSGVPYGCAMVHKTTAEASACLSDYGSGSNAYLSRSPQAWADLVHAASPSYTGQRPRVSIWHGTADSVVNFHSETELVKQWTGVHGVDPTTPSVTEQVEGFPHKVWKDKNGVALVEAYEITGQGHGTMVAPAMPVDPAAASGPKCGSAGSYILSAGICSTYYAGKFWGLDGTSTSPSGDGGASGSSSGGSSTGGASGGTGGGTSGGSSSGSSSGASPGRDGAGSSGGSAPGSGCGLAGCSVVSAPAPANRALALGLGVIALALVRRTRRARDRRV